jgi:hypothetical protein
VRLNLFGWLKFGHECSKVLRPERGRGESLLECLSRIIGEAHEWRKYGASKPQPAPQNQDGPLLWPMIISELGESELDRLLAADMLARHEFGVAKYGVPLVANNGRDHLRDAYEEALDCVVYLRAEYQSLIGRYLDHSSTQVKCVGRVYDNALALAKRIRELIFARGGK